MKTEVISQPRPSAERIVLDLTPEEFILLAVSVWRKMDGYEGKHDARTPLQDGIRKAFKEVAGGKHLDEMVETYGPPALSDVQSALNIARELGYTPVKP